MLFMLSFSLFFSRIRLGSFFFFLSFRTDQVTDLQKESAGSPPDLPESQRSIPVPRYSSTYFNGETQEIVREVENVAEYEEPATDEDGPTTTKTRKFTFVEEFNFQNLCAENRKYQIDMSCKVAFSRGDMISLLITSGVGRYLEFKVIDNSFMVTDGSMQQVPASKADVFQDTTIKPMDKRRLMKFLHFCTEYATDEEAMSEVEEFRYVPFVEFLQHRKLSEALQNFIMYAITLASKDQRADLEQGQHMTTEQGLQLMARYLQSLGRYGKTAFLFNLYGTSEFPQAFCRVCAVYQGIYVLDRPIHHLVVDETDNAVTHVIDAQGNKLRCKNLVVSPDYVAPLSHTSLDESRESGGVSRAICITDYSLRTSTNNLNLVVPPNTAGNEATVHVVQYNYESSMVPPGKCK
eukprot:TRINITY_DN1892_c0_g2_i1.p1 TRINITY_DN1892_c0_g2~~TRINITY_DN1892_c0_g2_i1.p1  ORF type:complete len:407 (-),score=110.23 TRINITY_DN1892_c0_g2_i1:96-1316(-)